MCKLTRTWVVGLLIVLAVGLTVLGASRLQLSNEPPGDLCKSIVPGNAAKAYFGDIYRGWYDWETNTKTIVIKRRERETAASTWYEQIQEVTTAYFVLDVRGVCSASSQIGELFVAGVYPDGDACIERWAFTYPPPPPGVYVPIDQRRIPSIRKTELFRGGQYGHIASLEPDPDGRFVLFLTYENCTLYRLSLPSGSISTELIQGTVPQLASMRSVTAHQHVTEGRQFHLYRATRWEAEFDPSRVIIQLKDRNNDGVFDPPAVFTPPQWTQHGYDAGSAWIKFCL